MNKSSTLNVRTPFGLLGGRLVAITEVANGLACGCTCPGCGAQLVARQGSRTWSFAHHHSSGTIACLETAIHAAGKQVLLDALGLVVPAFIVRLEARGPEGQAWSGQRILTKQKRVRFDSAEPEVWMGTVRPDVVGYRGDASLLIEIHVTHQVDAEKTAKLTAFNLPVLEIDLSDLPVLGAALGMDAVRERVLEDVSHKKWLVVPGMDQARAELRAELALARSEMEAERNKLVAQAALGEQLRLEERQRAQADRLARRAAARALPLEEKEAKLRAALGFGNQWPGYVRVLEHDSPALGEPTHVWQAMLFLVYVEKRKGGAASFGIGEVKAWAREWIGLASGGDGVRALSGYLGFLADRGFLTELHTGPMVRYRPADPATFGRYGRSSSTVPQTGSANPLVWCTRWPRRADLVSAMHALLSQNEHGPAILAALEDLSPLNCPVRPQFVVAHLATQGVPDDVTVRALLTLRLVEPYFDRSNWK